MKFICSITFELEASCMCMNNYTFTKSVTVAAVSLQTDSSYSVKCVYDGLYAVRPATPLGLLKYSMSQSCSYSLVF